jgi:hypothetical protein
MDIQSIINIIEYLNISIVINKLRRKPTVSEYSTINLYKARLLYLGAGEPPLRSLLIKDDILQKSIFGPPRPILNFLPSIYLFEREGNTYAQLGKSPATYTLRLNGFLGPWIAPENQYDTTGEFLQKNDFASSDLRRLGKLNYDELVATFQELIKRELEPQYLENLERYMIQVIF